MATEATQDPRTGALEVRDPTRGDVIRELRIDGADDVAAAAERARQAQPAWAARSPRERARALRRARRALARDRGAMLDLLASEYVLAGEWAGCRDKNVGAGEVRTGHRQCDGGKQQDFQIVQHLSLLR